MRVTVFLNKLGLGGTEKAACRWARGLRERGHEVAVLTLCDGPRRAELESCGIETCILPSSAEKIAAGIRAHMPDVIHAHAPGQPHEGDVLGEALARLARIPVVQTNIFGKFANPREDSWTNFRLFISWTSCVQAARRSYFQLNEKFFRRASVAVYPLDPDDGPGSTEITQFRRAYGVDDDEVLFGRLSRPEANKWIDLPLESFRLALLQNPRLKFLLREPPPHIAERLASAPDRDRFLILEATGDAGELRRTIASLDVVLHTSSQGESFGYGIAEPMNFGKPVITNSTPWADQAQVELVRHGEGGFVVGSTAAMVDAMLTLADDTTMRTKFGLNAQRHVRSVAEPQASLDRVEGALQAAITGGANPRISEDLAKAAETAAYLDAHQFGHSMSEQWNLRPFHYRVRFHEWRKARLFPGRIAP